MANCVQNLGHFVGPQTNKNGISCRRKTAGWDNKYLLKVLTADRDRFQKT